MEIEQDDAIREIDANVEIDAIRENNAIGEIENNDVNESEQLEEWWFNFTKNSQPLNQTCVNITSDTVTNQYGGIINTSKAKIQQENTANDIRNACTNTGANFYKKSSVKFRKQMKLESQQVTYPIPVDPVKGVKAPLSISTKTQIIDLNVEKLDLDHLFWNLPIVEYSAPEEGIVQKHINFKLKSKAVVAQIEEKVKEIEATEYVSTLVLSHIDHPTGKIKYIDKRSISIGISKNNLYNKKQKMTFSNCMALITRIRIDDLFHEFHVKLYNTGDIGIPGAKTESVFYRLVELVLAQLRKLDPEKYGRINTIPSSRDTIIVNTTFKFHKFVSQSLMVDVLRYKYKLYATYDPCCSHPGIHCDFYYDSDKQIQTGIRPSYMPAAVSKKKGRKNNSKANRVVTPPNITVISIFLFRTGSGLIVGKCKTDDILYEVYHFMLGIMQQEEAIVAFADPANSENKLKRPIIKKHRYTRTLLVNSMGY